jgi:hypothetical protein
MATVNAFAHVTHSIMYVTHGKLRKEIDHDLPIPSPCRIWRKAVSQIPTSFSYITWVLNITHYSFKLSVTRCNLQKKPDQILTVRIPRRKQKNVCKQWLLVRLCIKNEHSREVRRLTSSAPNITDPCPALLTVYRKEFVNPNIQNSHSRITVARSLPCRPNLVQSPLK